MKAAQAAASSCKAASMRKEIRKLKKAAKRAFQGALAADSTKKELQAHNV
jgi:hypothetical protein